MNASGSCASSILLRRLVVSPSTFPGVYPGVGAIVSICVVYPPIILTGKLRLTTLDLAALLKASIPSTFFYSLTLTG